MHLTDNEVLITGGASGIGLGLAGKFLEAGSRVIVCGRRENVLKDREELEEAFQRMNGQRP